MEALATVRGEGLEIPVRGARSALLPDGSWRCLIGRDSAPVVLKTTKRVEVEGEAIEPGTYFWSNRDQNLYARAENPHMAELAMAHTSSGYGYADVLQDGGELRWLEDFIATVRDGAYMLANWRGMSAEAKERLGRRLASIVDVPGMHRPRNLNKVQMRWRVGSSVALEDRQERPNPGATRAKLVTAGEDAQKRESEIRAIARYIDGRRVGIRQEMDNNMSVARQAHHELSNFMNEGVWVPSASEDLRDRLERLIGRLGTVCDVPWRNAFRRIVEDDLQYAMQFVGNREGIKYLDRAMIAIEVLEMYPELADLDLRLAITLDQRPRHPRRREMHEQKLGGLKSELEAHVRNLPVRVVKDEPKPGIDQNFRAPVTDKLYRRLERANAVWVRHDWAEVKFHLRDALAAFG